MISKVTSTIYTSPDGTQIPGDVEAANTPQMVTITFNGAINQDNIWIYQDIFKEERLNPNGCQIKGSFFVSHKYTNYSAVQELHRKGHEIGVFSVILITEMIYSQVVHS